MKINPIVITDKTSNEKYTLEFSRESVIFTNRQGFKPSEVEDNFEEMFPILWYGAFRMHHKNLSRTQCDDIFNNGLGGHVTKEVVARLCELYAEPRNSMIVEEEDPKNSKMTVEL